MPRQCCLAASSASGCNGGYVGRPSNGERSGIRARRVIEQSALIRDTPRIGDGHIEILITRGMNINALVNDTRYGH